MFDHKLLVVSGKGGVGKSAVAAALARGAARTGKKVLVIGLVDSLGLASHLGVERLTYQPREVLDGVYTFSVDRAQALDEYLREQLHVPRAAPTKQLTRALQALVDTAPGVREIISMGKPLFEVWKDKWDLVIVDAPPIGQLDSYLRAPMTIAGLVPRGPIREQATRMENSLRSPDSGLVVVATPQELPVIETQQGLAAIEAEKLIGVASVIGNRVLPPLGVSMAALKAIEGTATAAAARHHLGAYERQQHWLAKLPAGPRLPYLFGLVTPGEVAARLAEELA